jgi:hypothetical protein
MLSSELIHVDAGGWFITPGARAPVIPIDVRLGKWLDSLHHGAAKDCRACNLTRHVERR